MTTRHKLFSCHSIGFVDETYIIYRSIFSESIIVRDGRVTREHHGLRMLYESFERSSTSCTTQRATGTITRRAIRSPRENMTLSPRLRTHTLISPQSYELIVVTGTCNLKFSPFNMDLICPSKPSGI